jgi:hypothetical protein
MKHASFSRRAILLLVAAAMVLFCLSVVLEANTDVNLSSGEKSGPNAFSTSAIGHAGIYDVLRRLDRPVKRSIGNVLEMVGYYGVLVMVEPDLFRIEARDGDKLMSASTVLVVLPKWRGVPDAGYKAWISDADLKSVAVAEQTLNLVDGVGTVFRGDWPKRWEHNLLEVEPTGAGVVQLIKSENLSPLVGNDDGILLGAVIDDDDRMIWVLSDPDVMSNAGIALGDNLDFMVGLFDSISQYDAEDSYNYPIVFDETVHGFQQSNFSPLRLLFRFPMIVVTILVCLAAVVFFLAGASRFGAAKKAKPPLDFGKAGLIQNSARLLDYSGHHAESMWRYIVMTIRTTGQSLHAPTGLDEDALAAWLDRIARARGLPANCSDILRIARQHSRDGAKNPGKLYQCVHDIHRWQDGMIAQS